LEAGTNHRHPVVAITKSVACHGQLVVAVIPLLIEKSQQYKEISIKV